MVFRLDFTCRHVKRFGEMVHIGVFQAKYTIAAVVRGLKSFSTAVLSGFTPVFVISIFLKLNQIVMWFSDADLANVIII